MPDNSDAAATAPRPSLADRARTLFARSSTAALSTHLGEAEDGSPFGSLVAYTGDEAGRPILALSGLAVHTRNLVADPRASLLVTSSRRPMAMAGDPRKDASPPDPLAEIRVTLVGLALRVTGEERVPLRARFLDRHPAAERWIDFGDFAMWRLTPKRIWAVAGFGEMGWIDPETWAAATPDPLADAEPGILAHMNADHADALVDYCTVLAGVPATLARMTGIDRLGFDMQATLDTGTRAVRIAFDTDVTTPEQARRALVGLVHLARQRGRSPVSR